MEDLKPVRASVVASERLLKAQLDQRERLLKESRDVISACSRSIISIHNGKGGDAARELEAAGDGLRTLRKLRSGQLAKYLVSPETEFVEASVVFSIARGKKLPTMDSLSCSPEAYVLGLLDTVGELKRLVLDSMLDGRPKRAKEYFGSMQELYSICMPMAVYDHVANGVRRKLDVARMLVEDTRGLLAEEAGREELSSSMNRLVKRLDAEK